MANDADPSPLDAALDSIERDTLETPRVDPEPDDSGELEQEPPPVKPRRRRGRGRPRTRRPDTRQSHAAKPKVPPASGPVSNPPVPQLEAAYAPISPEAVAASIKQIDAIIVKLAGTTPLEDAEALGGGQVFAPVLDHYMPMLADKGALWLAPATWAILAYGPRVYEVLDRRQRRLEAEKRGIPFVDDGGAAPATNGRASFSAPRVADASPSAGPAHG